MPLYWSATPWRWSK